MTHHLQRCAWAQGEDALMERYHDEEWGVPRHDPRLRVLLASASVRYRMRTSHIAGTALSLLAALGAPQAWPQIAPTQRPSAQVPARAEELFDKYQKSLRGGPTRPAVNALVETLSNELPKSAANTAALRVLLAAKVSLDEKHVLVRLLGAQYHRDNPTGMNHLILADLKALSRAQDDELARRATYTYSRLGYFPDTQEVLAAARSRGLLNDTAYFGELAHVLPFAGADQVSLAKAIRASRSEHARDILAMYINGDGPVSLSPDARTELLAFFEGLEPRFGINVSVYDLRVGLDYADWLRGMAILKGLSTDAQRSDFIMRTLAASPSQDPRKIIAFLISPYGRWLVASVGDRSKFKDMVELIGIYSKQFPMSKDLPQVVDLARQVVVGT